MNPLKPIRWTYGITTIPSRREDYLPRTLKSLKAAGFDKPRLFVDGDSKPESWELEFSLPVTCRFPTIRTHGNWILALMELFIREPVCDRYAIFQDDVITYKNLKQYLESCTYPDGIDTKVLKGYWNLYTFPANQANGLKAGGFLAPDPSYKGWYRSNQCGWGALGLVFNRDAVLALLSSYDMAVRPAHADRGWRAVDGGIVTALAKARNPPDDRRPQYDQGWIEYVHNPTLVQHIGVLSSMGKPDGRGPKPGLYESRLSESFLGESYDAMELLRK